MSDEWRSGSGFLGIPIDHHSVGAFSFGHWYAAPSGDSVPTHLHIDAHFMFVVAGGYVTRVAGGGPLIYNPPQTYHRDRFEGGGSFFAVSIASGELQLPRTPARVSPSLGHALVARLMRENASWQRDSALIAQSLCLELVAAAGPQESADRRAPRWLAGVRSVLRRRLADALAIHDLAHAAGVHPIHLARTFRRFYRCTPGEYLRALRVQHAASLLASSNLTLAEVALESGFADQSHFTKIFRRAFGVAPGAYRRAVR
jgi:AraC family transcriptional regulator